MHNFVVSYPKTYQPHSCRKRCPGGNACICHGHIPHVLHICHDSRCACHSRERYEEGITWAH